MLDSETARELILPRMPVVASDGAELPPVDHIEGTSSIALAEGHFIPLSWVQAVDDRVHLDHTREEVEKEWTTQP